jgi:hypothetical protein
MKPQIGIFRLLLWLLLSAFVAPGFANQAQTPRVKEEVRDFKIFTDRVQAYIKMQKTLEGSLAALKATNDVAQIVEYQHALAGKIAAARRTARQGDIFTHEVTERFRKIIRSELSGHKGRFARETIRQDDPSKVFRPLHVNDLLLEGAQLTTTPPNLLLKLPELPQELTYRFVGRDLTLIDTKARLIVDFIPNVIP